MPSNLLRGSRHGQPLYVSVDVRLIGDIVGCRHNISSMTSDNSETNKDCQSGKPSRQGTVIRAYSPLGLYWHDDLHLPTAIYMNRGDLIFTACHFDKNIHTGDYYTEFDEPMVEEISLLSALLLSVGFDQGMIYPYPLGAHVLIDKRDDLHQLHNPVGLARLLRSCFEAGSESRQLDGLPPPLFGGPDYEFKEQSAPLSLQERIHAAIRIDDPLLMRGLGTLMKSMMLGRHRLFGEDAFYPLYISLEASYQLILKKLCALGIEFPNTRDAAEFMETIFKEKPSGRGYFEDYYIDRISAVHPTSRFGTFPYAPLMHDDLYWLFKALREVYRFLILDEVVTLES